MKKSTRPYAIFPFTIGDESSYQMHNIIHGLNYVMYLEKELPEVEVLIDHISISQARIILKYTQQRQNCTSLVYETFRIGINPNDPKSDGVLTGDGKKYASTFQEFVEKIRTQIFVSDEHDVQNEDNNDDVQNENDENDVQNY